MIEETTMQARRSIFQHETLPNPPRTLPQRFVRGREPGTWSRATLRSLGLAIRRRRCPHAATTPRSHLAPAARWNRMHSHSSPGWPWVCSWKLSHPHGSPGASRASHPATPARAHSTWRSRQSSLGWQPRFPDAESRPGTVYLPIVLPGCIIKLIQIPVIHHANIWNGPIAV